MSKDLLDDRYGRFRELSLELATLGHEVKGVCFSYSQRPEGTTVDSRNGADVPWISINLGDNWARGVIRHRALLRRVGHEWAPDVVFAVSDAYHAAQGLRLAQSLEAASCIDLYDNFESYRGMGVPGAKRLLRRTVNNADTVTCVSGPLVTLVKDSYGRVGPTEVLANGIPGEIFSPGDREVARKLLGLSPSGHIVGITGSIGRDRDVETVFRAADLLTQEGNEVTLLVAGPRDDGLRWPEIAPVTDLGVLEHDRIPDVIRASDVMVIPNSDTEFGQYCFPQKAVEALACAVPMVAADTPVMRELMADVPDGLYGIGRPTDLARALRLRLADRRTSTTKAATWSVLGRRLEEVMLTAVSCRARAAP